MKNWTNQTIQWTQFAGLILTIGLAVLSVVLTTPQESHHKAIQQVIHPKHHATGAGNVKNFL